MADETPAQSGPDLTKGVAHADLVDGRLVGHVGDDAVFLVQAGSEIFAVGAHCSHYHGPLGDGLVVGTSVRCPWHHACFDLRSGEAVRAPALSPIDCWQVEQRDGKIFVKEKLPQPKPKPTPSKGGVNRDHHRRRRRGRLRGGRDAAAARLWRRHRHVSAATAPHLSTGPICRKTISPAARRKIGCRFAAGFVLRRERHRPAPRHAKSPASTRKKREIVAGGKAAAFDRAVARDRSRTRPARHPWRRPPHVHVLRTLADSRAIIALAKTARRAVVIGASFIGLEVAAASLRARKIEVHVVAPEERPMERVLGAANGRFRPLAARGARRRLPSQGHGHDASMAKRATLKSGGAIDADLVVVGVGVRPRLALAEQAGLDDRSRRHGQRHAGDQRARHLCGGRHRALARSVFWRQAFASSIGSSPSARDRLPR